ncbi:MAG TPA: DUF488 domain-containing protein [Bryobacteraceae bacterium]|nr:DUF488 domain-containing protein [Bryobacteraceae bacterium]
MPRTIFTIGHSTRPIDEFIAILEAHGIERLVDVRTVPRSRKNPQFNADSLPETLALKGIAWEHAAALGGLRRARRDSPNEGWRNASFRGYADYMGTPEFRAAVDWLIETSADKTTVIMCAEAVPWRCHRSLIADALLVRSTPVRHIMSASKAYPHAMTSFARVDHGAITYPPQ